MVSVRIPDMPDLGAFTDACEVVGENAGSGLFAASALRTYMTAQLGLKTPFMYGAVGDGTTDDTTAIQAWLTALQASGTVTEGPAGTGYCQAGYKFKITAPLTVSKPIVLHCHSWLYFTPTTGSALIIGSSAPTGGRNTGYDIEIAGIRAVNGNASQPTEINASGTVGLEIRNCQFSRVKVGKVIAFTKAGIWLNATNTSYVGQHIQDNTFEFGEIAYNGSGILAQSASAADGAVQVNRITIQNTFTNWVNQQWDDATYNSNTNNNIIECHACDAPAAGGSGVSIYGSFNTFRFGYLNGACALAAEAFNNVIEIANPTNAGSTLTPHATAGNNNWMRTSTPAVAALPVSAAAPVSNTHYQNTYGVPVVVNMSALLTPTAGSAETCTAYIGQVEGSMFEANKAVVTAMATPISYHFPFSIIVPPGWWYAFTATGSGSYTFSTRSIYQIGA